MTCQTRRLWFIGSVGVLTALLVGEIPGSLAEAADPTVPTGESEAYQSLPPEKKRSLAQGMATDQSGEVETRGMPQLQRPMMPGNPVQPSAPGQPTAQVPTWPQKFDVQGPESDSFGFAVTQPGPVVVDVQSQGAPVIVTLQGPAPQPISQQGAGQVRLTYTVTPQDVQKGVLWGIQIRLAQPTPPQLGGRAGGSVVVQHPPVSQAAVQQAVQEMAAQQKQPSPQEQQQASAQAAAQTEQAFQQRKAQFDRQQLDRRATLHAQIQPQLDQLRSRMGTQIRPRGLEGAEGISGEPGVSTEEEISTRALQLERIRKTIVPPPPAVTPNPAIVSLSVTQGHPGDPVMITGSGFGAGGEVHFVIAPGKDLIVPAGVIWQDNQIFASVPDASGVLGFNGQVYIKRAQDQRLSNLVAFRFEPELETRTVRSTGDKRLGFPEGVNWVASPGPPLGQAHIGHNSGNPFWGFKGNDEFFINTRLKNNWVLDEVFLTIGIVDHAGAYIQDKQIGTNWPYFNIRFWVDPAFGAVKYSGSVVEYVYLVSLRGPKGVPDGIVVP